jgi:hypothetical protein
MAMSIRPASWARVALGVVLLVMIGIIGVAMAASGDATDNSCDAPSSIPGALTGPPKPLGLDAEAGNQAVTIPLGHDKAPNEMNVTFTAAQALPPLPIGVHMNSRGLKKQDGKGRIAVDAIGLTEEIRGNKLVVTVCIDPAKRHLSPGLYTGSVVVDDARLAGAGATINATVQYDHIWMLLLFGAVLIVGLSVFLVSITSDLEIPRSRTSFRAAIPTVVTIGLTLVAAVSVWYVRAYQSPTFGADGPPAIFTLLWAMLTSGFAAGHLGNRLSSVTQPGAGGGTSDPKPATSNPAPAEPGPALATSTPALSISGSASQ